MKDTFKSVKNDLNNDMYVMFSGTACQVAGLKDILVNATPQNFFSQCLRYSFHIIGEGTACQVAGLKRYLGKCDTSKLYTCDIACHGVPSPIIAGWTLNIVFVE